MGRISEGWNAQDFQVAKRLGTVVAWLVGFVLARAVVSSVSDWFAARRDPAAAAIAQQVSGDPRGASLRTYLAQFGPAGTDTARMLSARGMRRLSDDDAAILATIQPRLFDRMPIEECARAFRGAPLASTFTAYSAAINTLPAPARDSFAAVAAAASMAEFNGYPAPPPVDSSELLRVLVRVGEREDADSTRFWQALVNGRDIPDPEACWAQKEAYAGAAALGKHSAGIFVRAMFARSQ